MNKELISTYERTLPAMQPKDKTCFVYFLFNGNEIVYIGQTSNLSKRIAQHTRVNKFEFDTYSSIVVAQRNASEIESHLVDQCEPVYNRDFLPKQTREARIEEEKKILAETVNTSACEELTVYKIKGQHSTYKYFVYKDSLYLDTCRVLRKGALITFNSHWFCMRGEKMTIEK